MKVAVCEDNRLEAGELERIMEAWAAKQGTDISVVWYPTAEAFWFHYEEEFFDAVFLDIQMPGEDGVTLARKLRESGDGIPVVFVTGLDSFISAGYDVEAIHYLLKPVEEQKMIQCLERIRRRREQAEPVVLIDTDQGIMKIKQKDIIKIEVFGRECVYTTPGGAYKTVQSMKEAQEGLAQGHFISCYRGVLVNLQNVETICHDHVCLRGGITAPVSRRMYGRLNQAFIRFYQQ